MIKKKINSLAKMLLALFCAFFTKGSATKKATNNMMAPLPFLAEHLDRKALLKACQAQNIKEVKKILKQKKIDFRGQSPQEHPLIIAIQQGNRKLFSILLEAIKTDKDGASYLNYGTVIREYDPLEKGKNPPLIKLRPLFFAMQSKDLFFLHRLLQMPELWLMNPRNLRDNPLLDALKNGQKPHISMLLRHKLANLSFVPDDLGQWGSIFNHSQYIVEKQMIDILLLGFFQKRESLLKEDGSASSDRFVIEKLDKFLAPLRQEKAKKNPICKQFLHDFYGEIAVNNFPIEQLFLSPFQWGSPQEKMHFLKNYLNILQGKELKEKPCASLKAPMDGQEEEAFLRNKIYRLREKGFARYMAKCRDHLPYGELFRHQRQGEIGTLVMGFCHMHAPNFGEMDAIGWMILSYLYYHAYPKILLSDLKKDQEKNPPNIFQKALKKKDPKKPNCLQNRENQGEINGVLALAIKGGKIDLEYLLSRD